MKKLISSLFMIFALATASYSNSYFNVSDYNELSHKKVNLNCKWDFYWGRFVPYNDLSIPDLVVNVPEKWNNYVLNDEQVKVAKKGEGSATYRLVINNLKPETNYSFETYRIAMTSFTILCGDKIIFESGKACEDWKKSIPGQKAGFATFCSDENGTAVLTFWVSNNFYRKGGLVRKIRFSEESFMKNNFFLKQLSFYILVGILFTIFIYSSIQFILKHDFTNLYLAVFVLSILFRITFDIFPIVMYFFSDITFDTAIRFEYLALFIAPAAYTMYVYFIHKSNFKHINPYILSLPSIIFLVLDILLPGRTLNRLVPAMQFYMYAIIAIDLVIFLVNGIRHKDIICVTTIYTILILAAGAGTRILINNGITLLNSIDLLPLSLVVFALVHTIFLAWYQNNNQLKVELLNVELERLNKAYYRFVPEEFLKLLNIKEITELKAGENKAENAALLSADIRNFTSISETLTEIQVFEMLNTYLKKIAPIIRKHNGIIEKYLGDGIIAIFPKSANSALNCAIEMQEIMNVIRKELFEKNLPDIKIGIGVHYGNIIIGAGGDDERITEISLSKDIDKTLKTEALTKTYLRPIIITEAVLKKALLENKSSGKTFSFEVKGISSKENSKLFYIFNKKTGDIL